MGTKKGGSFASPTIMDFFDAPFEFDAYPDQQIGAGVSTNNHDSSFSSGADFVADDGMDACSPLDWNKIAADLPPVGTVLRRWWQEKETLKPLLHLGRCKRVHFWSQIIPTKLQKL